MTAAFLDLEGPLSPQDNAYEVAAKLPRGKELFERISSYDDELALRGTAGYEAGDTLALIAPFLVAGGITDHDVEEVSDEARLVDGAPELVEHLQRDRQVYIISTSYSDHAENVGRQVGVEPGEVRCTELDLDALHDGLDDDFFDLVGDRKEELIDGTTEILDHFFFSELPETSYGDPFKRVRVVGGARKADAVRNIAQEQRLDLSRCIAVGDSITDREMLQLLREKGGRSVVFNGNQYAIPCGDYGVASTDLRLVELFSDLDEPDRVAREWGAKGEEFAEDPSSIPDHLVPEGLRPLLEELDPFPEVQYLPETDEEAAVETHSRFRELLRGEAAKLG